MSEPTTPASGDAEPQPPDAATHAEPHGLTRAWEHIQHHKVVHWTLAYAAAAYTLLHGVEMLSEAQEWPHMIVRVLSLVLVLGVPIVALLAWYHGHKAQHRISGPELAMLTVLLFIAGTLLWAFSRSNEEHAEQKVEAAVATPEAATETTPTATPAAPRTAIAVMPFVNLTGDASKEYLGDGMAEAMINTLTKVSGLKVPARTSTFAYKGRGTDIRQIAKDLGVGTILEGSVQAAGKRLRITAQLINAQDGLHLWSETYDEEFTDIFKLQDKLATAISSALQPNLNGSAATIIAQTQPTQDVEAYDLYLQGASLLARGSFEAFRQARPYFERALARDPKFARAYAGLATSYMMEGGNGNVASARIAEENAKKALALDPTNAPDARTALAGIRTSQGRFNEGLELGQAELEANPNDAYVRAVFAVHYLYTGHSREALELVRSAYAASPGTGSIVDRLSFVYSTMGNDAEATRYANIVAGLGATGTFFSSFTQARVALHAQRFVEAGQAFARLGTMDSEWAKTAEVSRLIFAALADPKQRSAALSTRVRLYPKGASIINESFNPQACAVSGLLYTLLGELDVAYDLMNQCVDQAPGKNPLIAGHAQFLWSPEWRPFREDRRFQDYATRLGLMDYWRQHGPPDDCDLKDGKLTCH